MLINHNLQAAVGLQGILAPPLYNCLWSYDVDDRIEMCILIIIIMLLLLVLLILTLLLLLLSQKYPGLCCRCPRLLHK